MLFYRIEHKDTKHGCYTSSASSISKDTSENHPMASDDTKLMLSYKLKEKEYDYWRNCRHGFNSIDQLKAAKTFFKVSQ